MPSYTYECSGCEHRFEWVSKMKDRKAPLSQPCPECNMEETVFRAFDVANWVDPGILKADKNLERSGVLKELNRLKEHHPYMLWKG